MAFQLLHTPDGGAAGGADGVLHSAGMLGGGQVEFSGASKHLGGQAVGKLPGQAVAYAGVAQSLQKHGGVSRSAAGDGSCNAHLGGGHCGHFPKSRKKLLDLGQLLRGKGVFLLQKQHALADGYRRVGHQGQVMDPGREDLLEPVKGPPCRHREQHFPGKLFPDRGQHFLNQVGLYR